MIEISTYNANEIIEVDRTSTDINDILIDTEFIIMSIPAVTAGGTIETGYAFQS